MTSSKPAKTLFDARPAVSLCQRLLTAMPPTAGKKMVPKIRQVPCGLRTGTQIGERTGQHFLYAVGDCADDILATFFIDEETVSFADIKTELNSYLVKRACFNKRVQRESEAIDSFLQDLYKIAEGCNYGTLKEELIRDRIVVGVADDDLSEQLQSKANLTLQEAVQPSRQTEDRKESQHLVRESRSSAAHDVNFIKKKP